MAIPTPARTRARQDDLEHLAAHAPGLDEAGHVVHVGGAEVGGAAAHVLQDRAVHAFAQDDLDARTRGAIARDDRRKQAAGHRHDAGNDDPDALLAADLAHAGDADAQVVEHALGDGDEFLAGRRDGDPPRAAVEQPHPEHVLDALDGSRQGRLGGLQNRGGGDEAVVLCHGEDRVQLAGGQIGDVGGMHGD
jgi:hypothetical protein